MQPPVIDTTIRAEPASQPTSTPIDSTIDIAHNPPQCSLNPQPSYAGYLTTVQAQATAEFSRDPKGKPIIYPSKAELITSTFFGKPSIHHSFTREADFNNILLPLFKSQYLDSSSLSSLLLVDPSYEQLFLAYRHSLTVDFSPLRSYNTSYANQSSIPTSRVELFLALAIHYDLHIPSIIRYLGGNYTKAYLDVPAILQLLRSFQCPIDILRDVERIYTVGSPAIFHLPFICGQLLCLPQLWKPS